MSNEDPNDREQDRFAIGGRRLLVAAQAERDFEDLTAAGQERVLQLLREPNRPGQLERLECSKTGKRRRKHPVYRYRVADVRLLILSRDGVDYLWRIGDRKEVYAHLGKRFDTRVPLTAITIEEFLMRNAAKQTAKPHTSSQPGGDGLALTSRPEAGPAAAETAPGEQATHPLVEEIRRLVGDGSRAGLDALKASLASEAGRLDGEILRQWERVEALASRHEAAAAETTRVAAANEALAQGLEQIVARVDGVAAAREEDRKVLLAVLEGMDGQVRQLAAAVPAVRDTVVPRLEELIGGCEEDRKAVRSGLARLGREIERLASDASDLRSRDAARDAALRLVKDEAGENAVVVSELAASVAALRAEVQDLRGLLHSRPLLDRLRSLSGRICTAFAGRAGDPTAA